MIVQRAGSLDYHGRPVERSRATVVGVYVRGEQRGSGLIDRLLEGPRSGPVTWASTS